MNEVDDQIKKKGVKKGLAFSSAALGEAHVAADLVCVQESDRKRARGIQKDRGQEREGKGGQVAAPLSLLQSHTDTLTQTYMLQQKLYTSTTQPR